MNSQEAKLLEAKLTKFNLLAAARSALYSTRDKMRQKSGEPGTVQSHDKPFTGNTRESRHVTSMKIGFSATLGGEPPVELELHYLNVPAYELGQAIEKLIGDRLAQFEAEMEKL